MSRQSEVDQRAIVAARVEQYGSVDKAWPRDQMTMRAWREVCAHLGVTNKGKARDLDEALARLAELAG